ncbi:hypothetical protein ACLB2K_029814 [Fragaria x ananassa]
MNTIRASKSNNNSSIILTKHYIKRPKPLKKGTRKKGVAKQKAGKKKKAEAGGVNTDKNKRGKEGEENKRSKKQNERGKEAASQQEGGALTLTLFISFAASLSFCLVPCSAGSPASTQAISP